MEDEDQELLWWGTLAEQHRAAVCLWSDLSGKMWLVSIINPHLSLCLSPPLRSPHPSVLFPPFFFFFCGWDYFFFFIFHWSVNSPVQCFLCEQLRGMTLRGKIERHLSERDIKSNKDLSWLWARGASRELGRPAWTGERQKQRATVNISAWQRRKRAVRRKVLAHIFYFLFF